MLQMKRIDSEVFCTSHSTLCCLMLKTRCHGTARPSSLWTPQQSLDGTGVYRQDTVPERVQDFLYLHDSSCILVILCHFSPGLCFCIFCDMLWLWTSYNKLTSLEQDCRVEPRSKDVHCLRRSCTWRGAAAAETLKHPEVKDLCLMAKTM